MVKCKENGYIFFCFLCKSKIFNIKQQINKPYLFHVYCSGYRSNIFPGLRILFGSSAFFTVRSMFRYSSETTYFMYGTLVADTMFAGNPASGFGNVNINGFQDFRQGSFPAFVAPLRRISHIRSEVEGLSPHRPRSRRCPGRIFHQFIFHLFPAWPVVGDQQHCAAMLIRNGFVQAIAGGFECRPVNKLN